MSKQLRPDVKQQLQGPPPEDPELVLNVEIDDIEIDLDKPEMPHDDRPWLISNDQLMAIGLPPRPPTDPTVLDINEDPTTLQRQKLAAQVEKAQVDLEMSILRLKKMREEQEERKRGRRH